MDLLYTRNKSPKESTMHYLKIALETVGILGAVIAVLGIIAGVAVIVMIYWDSAHGRNPFQ